MATLIPFRAVRPRPTDAALIAAVPYDVVTTPEARALADGNPLSFLRVSRPEIEFSDGVDPHSDEVYRRAAENFSRLKQGALIAESEPSVYLYRLRMDQHEQTGVAACYSIDEYEHDIIKKHERTRPDKEDDRTRHMLELCAQTGPVFLTYRVSAEVNLVAARVTRGEPLIDFQAADGVQHTVWRVDGVDRDALVGAFERIPSLYIADGHHRAASAARARAALVERGTGSARANEAHMMLAVAFPHDQVHILPYNRLVKDLAGLTVERFLEAVAEAFTLEAGPATPVRRGDIAMYVQGQRQWQTIRSRQRPDPADPIASLDASVLQDRLLAPVLRIADVRTNTRIEFVGGARGTSELQQAVDSGKAAVAFSLYPVSVADLMAVSDANKMMPPKSTWFEPKLRDGLLIHEI
jgi:uncharacterized protein (DUF1015 family)